MTLSSWSFAAGHRTESAQSPVSTGQGSLSRSPFQVDREKARHAVQPPAPARSVATSSAPRAPAVVASSASVSTGQAASATAYNPWLTLTLKEGHLLSQEIDAWATAQGLHPLWNSHRDYLIYSTITLTGSSQDDILSQLGQLFRSENYGLVVKLYEKNNVLVIDGQ
ncbi:pilus assembly protein [Salmonella enterica subsp. enterica serovar Newport]|nr:pilus assembly protein [Salmonella enterica subsp. enterica serovar Newport]